MDELHTGKLCSDSEAGQSDPINTSLSSCITLFLCCGYTHDVDEHLPQAVIASLVGEAIATLAELGVSPQVLGEFALRYPAKVAATLGTQPHRDEPTDLEKVVFEQVTRAIRADKGMHVSSPKKDGYRRLNIMVKGKRTSITINSSLLGEAERITGSRNAGLKIIQQIAEKAPEGVRRSGWTEQELHQRLLFLKSTPAAGSQH